MVEKTSAVLVSALNELMDSCNEKPTCGKTREWVKRREQSGYFNNIVKELKVEDRLGFREMFRMDVGDFEFILGKISHLISPRQMSNFGGHLPIMPDEKLALTGSYYYNYKHTHSIILLAIAGPEYECLYADVGSNGRVNDSGVWNKSSLLQAIQNGSVKLPKDNALPNSVISYVFVDNNAFALEKFMMKPYPQQNLTADKRVYNYRHSRARRISENLFGILANRWRIFFTTINLEPKHVENIVLSALVLHNMLIKNPAYRPGNLADTLLEDGEVLEGEWRDNVATDSFYPLQIPRSGHNPSIAAKIETTSKTIP